MLSSSNFIRSSSNIPLSEVIILSFVFHSTSVVGLNSLVFFLDLRHIGKIGLLYFDQHCRTFQKLNHAG